MNLLRVVYIANIVVAGWISITSLYSPRLAAVSVFSGAYPSSEHIRLVGALWLSIAVLSALGLWKPLTFSPILLVQHIYKGAWLLVVALPATMRQEAYPKGMALFFVIWVVILPFIIPWKSLFANTVSQL